nr:MAG TPA: hypothetical protein [Caudoviricetes sp.]
MVNFYPNVILYSLFFLFYKENILTLFFEKWS